MDSEQVRGLISRRKELHRAFRSHNDLWMYGCTPVYLFKESETIVVEVKNDIPVLPDGIKVYCPRCWGNG